VTLPSLREGTVNKRLVAFAFSFRCRRILSGMAGAFWVCQGKLRRTLSLERPSFK
jgi:hypothetical protein